MVVAVVLAMTRGHRHAEDGDRSREDDINNFEMGGVRE